MRLVCDLLEVNNDGGGPDSRIRVVTMTIVPPQENKVPQLKKVSMGDEVLVLPPSMTDGE